MFLKCDDHLLTGFTQTFNNPLVTNLLLLAVRQVQGQPVRVHHEGTGLTTAGGCAGHGGRGHVIQVACGVVIEVRRLIGVVVH